LDLGNPFELRRCLQGDTAHPPEHDCYCRAECIDTTCKACCTSLGANTNWNYENKVKGTPSGEKLIKEYEMRRIINDRYCVAYEEDRY